VAAFGLAVLALAGCSSASASTSTSGMALPKVWGYVAGAKFAQLEVADQYASKELTVSRVVAPMDAWIVVHIDDNGKPGDRVGLQHISAGESRDVKVALKESPKRVIVAVHADKGTPGTFDFDMMKKAESPDRPFFVNEQELAKSIALK
jgi:hypothetical protein